MLPFLFSCIKIIYYRIFLILFSVFKIDNKKIIIVNYNGNGYGDNGKYICNELMKYDYKIYWAAKRNNKNSLPKEINYINYDSLKFLYHVATAKIWINNLRFSLGFRKRKKQFYIQTWHGSIGFKKSEAAVQKNKSSYSYLLPAKHDSKMIDLLISNSKFCTNFYKNYFLYDGKILECGCPRNDIIINNNEGLKEKVKKYFGFSDSVKICLYAPTFRDDKGLEAYNMEYQTLISALKNKFKGDWKLLIRLHPSVSHLIKQLPIFTENIINATDYPDMQELLVAVDFMITDYSSCVFDYAISNKPAMVYASDIEKYRNDRDYFIKFEDSPFPLATNNEELENIIKNFDINNYLKNLNKFYKNNGLKETGKACEIIVGIINEITNIKK